MTTNETSFFRDRHPFEAMRQSILPELIRRRAQQKHLRIWSAACSTGQEAYSLAIMLADAFPMLASWRIEIVGTDISPTVLARAREAAFSTFEVQRGLPIQLLVKHFTQQGDRWSLKPELKKRVAFQPFNLLGDLAPLGSFDVIFCRNVLIYFDLPTKSRILEGMHRRLAADGSWCWAVRNRCSHLPEIHRRHGIARHLRPGGRRPAARRIRLLTVKEKVMSLNKSMRVLIVDDYSTMLRILRNLLRQLELNNIEEANNGEDALALMKHKPFDLVISD